MRRFFLAVALTCASLVALQVMAGPAEAGVVVTVDKSSQSMSVVVDGREQYRWPVSTGLGGGPPSGTFRAERLERKWYSRRYDWSPMPHAIFFHHGFAIHGTYQVSRLGRPASHGCVRLHPSHAATLFALVQNRGMARTTIVVSGRSRYTDGR